MTFESSLRKTGGRWSAGRDSLRNHSESCIVLHFVFHTFILLYHNIILSTLIGWRLSVLINDMFCCVLLSVELRTTMVCYRWVQSLQTAGKLETRSSTIEP